MCAALNGSTGIEKGAFTADRHKQKAGVRKWPCLWVMLITVWPWKSLENNDALILVWKGSFYSLVLSSHHRFLTGFFWHHEGVKYIHMELWTSESPNIQKIQHLGKNLTIYLQNFLSYILVLHLLHFLFSLIVGTEDTKLSHCVHVYQWDNQHKKARCLHVQLPC